MEAIDTTYQATVNLQKDVETVEAKESDNSYKEELDFLIINNEDEALSFKELMDVMFDEKKEDLSLIDEKKIESEDILFPNEEITIDEDVNSLMSSVSKKDAKKLEIFNDGVDERSFFFSNEDVIDEKIPVVEYAIDVANFSAKEKVKSDNVKNVKIEDLKSEKESAKRENVTKEEDKTEKELLKNVSFVSQNKKEKNVKTKDEKIEKVNNDVDVMKVGTVEEQKVKKVALKKLPITVEDLRTFEDAKVSEAELQKDSGEGFQNDFSSDYRGSEKLSYSSGSEVGKDAMLSESVNENNFSSILADQIKANATELVERGKIILRDGNIGEIRLQLKPEHLGNVRIQLKMTGNKKMQGEVIVSSKEAYDAFEESIGELVASFKDAGFDSSSFNLNWKKRESEEIVQNYLADQYFSPENAALTLSEKLNFTENIYKFGQAENINVLV